MTALPRIGEVIKHESGDYIVTERWPHGVPYSPGFAVLTPIPKGCKPKDLGSKFKAAYVMRSDLEPNERAYSWEEVKDKAK